MAIALWAWTAAARLAASPPVDWIQLSSTMGDLPVPPGGSTMQTGALTGDFDNDGLTDFVLSFRQKAPALAWYRHTSAGWDAYVIEKDYLTVEAGGATCDIDGDGDLDIVFGGDWQSNEVWWWENPSPHFDKSRPWKRHTIKQSGATQHHDQVIGDFLGTGKPQLVFWNQNAKTIFLAEIPKNPREAESWPMKPIFTGTAGEEGRDTLKYPEGISAFDIDADGEVDLLAGNTWFKHLGNGTFKPIRIADVGGLIFAGYFKPTKHPQIVISPGDAIGRVRWYECTGNPENPKDWVGHDLIDRDVIHGHSLQLGDINHDGYLDIFVAEMAKWSESKPNPDNPQATAWVFYGDGQGNFTQTVLTKSQGWHEARLADLDGDGDLDVLNKPYNWQTPRVDIWLNNGTRRGARGIGTSASFHGPVGLELYSLRDIFAKNVPLGLQFAKNFGFVEVELAGTYGMAPEKYAQLLDRYGLKPIGAMYDYNLWANEPEKIIKEAKALGLAYAGCAWIPHDGTLTEDAVTKAAILFNKVGALLAKSGIQFFYHNHGYEFVPCKDGTLFDRLMQETDPKLVAFEMDVFWVVHPGQDPVALLKKYPTRWQLFHVKDMRNTTQTGLLTGGTDVRNDVSIGMGKIDVAAALREAANLGVKHFFIEDESPDVIEQIPLSLRFLRSLQW